MLLRIAPGDTLSAIALRTKLSVELLAQVPELNSLGVGSVTGFLVEVPDAGAVTQAMSQAPGRPSVASPSSAVEIQRAQAAAPARRQWEYYESVHDGSATAEIYQRGHPVIGYEYEVRPNSWAERNRRARSTTASTLSEARSRARDMVRG
ncbi:MAG: LysM peptidoglycan-binding domain-containing protein [Myxococcota bacterium]